MIDTKLKELNVNGTTIYYKTFFRDSEYGSWEWTEFYRTNNKTKPRLRYYIFGNEIQVPDNKMSFKVDFDVEDCHMDKDEVRRKVTKAMNRQQKLHDRCKEIKNGNII
jgi:hypothetical protein